MLLFVASRDKSRNRQFALIVVCSNDGGHGQRVARSLAGSLARWRDHTSRIATSHATERTHSRVVSEAFTQKSRNVSW